MTGFIAVDMLGEISKTLEYENDWTRLKDGVLECRLRDQYDGEHTGLARVTVDKAGKVSVMAWSDNPREYTASRSLRTCSRSCGVGWTWPSLSNRLWIRGRMAPTRTSRSRSRP